MRHDKTVAAIIPALNEEQALPKVLRALPSWIDQVYVCDNGSTDDTAAIAAHMGAVVLPVARRGYGWACQAGVDRAQSDIVLFLDGDFSDYPDQADRLVDPIATGQTDLVIGSRVRGHAAPGALTLTQRFGNWLAVSLITALWGYRFTDLGPFRAVRSTALTGLNMTEMTFGWTVEMQVKAIQQELRVVEVPVDYRARIGRSKISGTIKGSLLAGMMILKVIAFAKIRRR